jgi:hypothetical protein
VIPYSAWLLDPPCSFEQLGIMSWRVSQAVAENKPACYQQKLSALPLVGEVPMVPG